LASTAAFGRKGCLPWTLNDSILTRFIGSRTSRRVAVGLTVSGLLSIKVPEAAAAKCSKQKPCPKCKRCHKHKCKPDANQNNDSCDTGKTCLNGACVAGTCSTHADCPGAGCVGRTCGLCTQSEHCAGACEANHVCPCTKSGACLQCGPDERLCEETCASRQACCPDDCSGGHTCVGAAGPGCVCPPGEVDCGTNTCSTCCVDDDCTEPINADCQRHSCDRNSETDLRKTCSVVNFNNGTGCPGGTCQGGSCGP
jgi:hypothetical protein